MGAVATEPMFQYAMPPSGGTHGLRRKKIVEAWALARGFLETCTDAVGPTRIEGAPADRIDALQVARRDTTNWRAPLPPPTLDAITQLIDELVRDGRPRRLTLSFEFLLRDPDTGNVLPYGDGHFPGGYSDLLLFLEDGAPSRCYLGLKWPYEDPNHLVARMCEAVEATLNIKLSEDKWYAGERLKNGKIADRRCSFGRDERALLLADVPIDDLDRRLLAAIAAAPDDDGPRLAYADVLAQRGDPRGELIVVQCQLARLAPDDPARGKLARREKALLARHGKVWLRIPFAQTTEMSRGFVERIEVDEHSADSLGDAADQLLRIAPTLREIVLVGRAAPSYEGKLRASPLGARVRTITTRRA